MLEELERIFNANAEGGEVAFDYETKLYYGQLKRK